MTASTDTTAADDGADATLADWLHHLTVGHGLTQATAYTAVLAAMKAVADDSPEEERAAARHFVGRVVRSWAARDPRLDDVRTIPDGSLLGPDCGC
ncbi:hypothetical protein ACFYS8_36320 [Kitasatospora sp. NPDC004615]|uniref:hypothetical protein n=1 Tax=Kitasatospora sp. NPDC004615 TaxID=3364017 RepID=UPI0036AE5A17